MADRPIIFSGPMVRALLAGRKTQTRRLATSPLRLCQPGDRLWVRERSLVTAIDNDLLSLRYEADGSRHGGIAIPGRLKRPAIAIGKRLSMGCYREASRLTLIVEDVKIEPLRDISEADAIAEGIHLKGPLDCDCSTWTVVLDRGRQVIGTHAVGVYWRLWDTLHPRAGERREDNPDVVAITFRVARENIDGAEFEALADCAAPESIA